jgi:hypothetical protein
MYKLANIKNQLRSQIPAQAEFSNFCRIINYKLRHHKGNILQLPGYSDDKGTFMIKWDFQPETFHSDTFENLSIGIEIKLPAPHCLWLTLFITEKADESTKLELRHYPRAIRFNIAIIANALIATSTILLDLDRYLMNLNEDYRPIAMSLLNLPAGYTHGIVND